MLPNLIPHTAQPQPIQTLIQGMQLKARHLTWRLPLLLHEKGLKNESTSLHRGLWHRTAIFATSQWYHTSVSTPTFGKPCMSGTSTIMLNTPEQRQTLLWLSPLLTRTGSIHLSLPQCHRRHLYAPRYRLSQLKSIVTVSYTHLTLPTKA